jgi:hypothetical protein
LKYVSTTLRQRFPEDKLEILVAKRNAGSFTYDGVDTGGERVASEVEHRLEELAENGHDIKKISVIGYSLGGLIARFAIGLLYSRGVFNRIQPVVRHIGQRKEIPQLTLEEFHHLCHTTSWRADALERLP